LGDDAVVVVEYFLGERLDWGLFAENKRKAFDREGK
jgi:hypothetical protein